MKNRNRIFFWIISTVLLAVFARVVWSDNASVLQRVYRDHLVTLWFVLLLGFIIGNPLLRRYLARISRAVLGKRTSQRLEIASSCIALSVIGFWIVGTLISAITNARNLVEAKKTIQLLEAPSDTASLLQGLFALQQQIEIYEQRAAHGPPVWSRFGVNRDAEILAMFWPSYAKASKAALAEPMQINLEAALERLAAMPTDSLNRETSTTEDGRNALATYLMLAKPSRVDSDFITPQLRRYWSTNARIPIGVKLDLSMHLLNFYGKHLKDHGTWRIRPHSELIERSRRALFPAIGPCLSHDAAYREILTSVGRKYPDQTLATLTTGTDARRLFRTNATVPGVFTRQAYEGSVAVAVHKASMACDVTMNWVLTGAAAEQMSDAQRMRVSQAPEALQLALTTRYFSEYAQHWQKFMNSLQWETAPSIAGDITQMRMLADLDQSPVIALLHSLRYHGTIQMGQALLHDKMLTRSNSESGKKNDAGTNIQASFTGPLSGAFGPVLRLTGSINETSAGTPRIPTGDVSLRGYIERVTALSMKVEQVNASSSADARARHLAMELSLGVTPELADAKVYATSVADSLGVQWSGMGDALFVRPVEQAAQAVLKLARGIPIVASHRTSGADRQNSDVDHYDQSPTRAHSLTQVKRTVANKASSGVVDRSASASLPAQSKNELVDSAVLHLDEPSTHGPATSASDWSVTTKIKGYVQDVSVDEWGGSNRQRSGSGEPLGD